MLLLRKLPYSYSQHLATKFGFLTTTNTKKAQLNFSTKFFNAQFSNTLTRVRQVYSIYTLVNPFKASLFFRAWHGLGNLVLL